MKYQLILFLFAVNTFLCLWIGTKMSQEQARLETYETIQRQDTMIRKLETELETHKRFYRTYFEKN